MGPFDRPGPAAAAVRSRYTLAEPWPDGRGILVNTLSGAVDIVTAETALLVHRAPQLLAGEAETGLLDTLLERGHYVESLEAEEEVARYVGRRAKERAVANGKPKYMFAVTLRCNLSCDYCWQVLEHGETRQQSGVMSGEMLDAAFAYVADDLRARGHSAATVSLFGGEPLLDTPQAHALVAAIGERCLERGLDLHITTNGLALAAFSAETARFRPSIQVTVDGCAVDDAGALVLLRAGQPLPGLLSHLRQLACDGCVIYLRFLATRTTVHQFTMLAEALADVPGFGQSLVLAVAPIQNKTEFIDRRNPPKYRVLEALLAALAGKPYASRIAYVDWRSLLLLSRLRLGEDRLPEPMFFHCEANVDLTCFDGEGRLYACYEAIGDPAMAVGRYWPQVEIDKAHLSQYRDRSAFSMPECTECPVSPICGGGCEVRGHKRNGEYMLPYCDHLRGETRMVLRNWVPIHALLTGHPHGSTGS